MRWPWRKDVPVSDGARASRSPERPGAGADRERIAVRTDTFPANEPRASGDYTDVLTALLVARADGAPVDPAATAALETAAGLVARAFSVATVEPRGARTAALTPSVLACIGRELIRRGEAVFALRVALGGVRALPVPHFDVRGGADPDSWWYRIDLPGPDVTSTESVPGAGVLHFRFATDPRRPWEGIAPLAWASSTGRLSGALEQALAGEAAGPFGHLVPLPDVGADKAELKADIDSLRGGVKLVDTAASGWGEGRAAAPAGDWKQQRIGADPPAGVVSLRSDAAMAVLAACGVPPPLVAPGDGTAAREAWRRFLHGTIHPLGAIVAEEAASKLGIDGLSLGFDRLFASDLSGRARAFQSMVGGGMDLAKAAALAGLMDAEA